MAALRTPGGRIADSNLFAALSAIAMGVTIIAAMFFGRAILVPVALAVLLTFILAPIVTRMECLIGRIPSVGVIALIVFTGVGVWTWFTTHQTMDLLTKLPDYRTNIQQKLRTLSPASDGRYKRFSEMISEMERDLPAVFSSNESAAKPEQTAIPPPATAYRVAPVDPMGSWWDTLAPLLHGIAAAGIVLLLVGFMLIKREDLRARFVKLVSRGNISTTARAMEDAAGRVSRYLLAQLIVNVVFGAAVAGGLFAIGVPNALLWGTLSTVLRFVPFVGVPFAAIGPLVLALAVSPGWAMLWQTILLFAALELITANIVEPLLFRTSTGVSSIALIVAAIFWGWLWGPVGIILSTPLTVCIVVIGTHVRQLSFLSLLLGDSEAFAPPEDCYHRLLVGGVNEATPLIETLLKSKTPADLYQEVLVPTLVLAEQAYDRRELDDLQRAKVTRGVGEIVEELGSRSLAAIDEVSSLGPEGLPDNAVLGLRIACVPVRPDRDGNVAAMLGNLLRERHDVEIPDAELHLAGLMTWVRDGNFDVVCVCALRPSTSAPIRHLFAKLREDLPGTKFVVATVSADEGIERSMAELPADESFLLATSVQAAAQCVSNLAATWRYETDPKLAAADEALRLAAVRSLTTYHAKSVPGFDRMTQELTHVFDVPIALLTFIDDDRQLFKSQFGLPAHLADVCDIPRSKSVCTHAVAANALLVVEDLARDRRFANNPLLKENNLRFYAGAPLHAANGQPIGALCIMDVKPRKFGKAEQRMLSVMAAAMSKEIAEQPAPELQVVGLS